jgi:hypothetical protein
MNSRGCRSGTRARVREAALDTKHVIFAGQSPVYALPIVLIRKAQKGRDL